MLRFFNSRRPFNRRDFLRVGALGLGGLSLADLSRLRASDSRVVPNDKAIILLWCGGGPSHLETYELMLDAPSTVRSLCAACSSRTALE